MIIFDENIEQRLVSKIENEGFEFVSIKGNYQGLSDKEIIHLAKEMQATIITEDKDFGELFFAHGLKNCSVIFLRYSRNEFEEVFNNLLSVLNNVLNKESLQFITIRAKSIRIKKI
ncbi:DUF5615 family PIN-like protein [Aquiflexum gelatinilyticum]|uniref:DUF5615 family PIN-like protein n=1 Tax=Aquiflexum gelatinilyticum TaxID=2961943 RepID=A0A9X2P739_9BACT|nr:DUF5615 family PIN-like protein [Aquiflexum gelatinilyticum]